MFKYTGCLTNIDPDYDINKISVNQKDLDKDNEKKIVSCELKYEFTTVSTIDSLNIIIKDF